MPRVKRERDLRSTTSPVIRPARKGPAPPPSSLMPDEHSVLYTKQEPAWTMLEDLLGGTRALREKASYYLPKTAAEPVANWNARVLSSYNYNALAHTVSGLTGMVFRRDPQLGDDVGPEMKAFWEDVDGGGVHGDLFARHVFALGLSYGHAAILTDFPAPPEGEPTTEAVPYWVAYRAPDIVSGRTDQIDGILRLRQIVFKEPIVEPVGDFGDEEVTQYRVFRLRDDNLTVEWEVWRPASRVTSRTPLVIEASGTLANQTEIPVAIIYCGHRVAPLYTKPPLEDLAYTNLEYFQVRSDYRHSLHKASVPILVLTGRTSTGPVTVSPDLGLDLPQGASAQYVEHSGSALDSARQELQDLKEEMAALGLSMLVRETRAAETAEAKRIDKSEQDSRLASAARSLQDGLELSMGYAARYLGLNPIQGGSLMVNREFDDLVMDPQAIAAYLDMYKESALSLETFWEILQKGNALPDDFEAAAEKKRIKAEAPARIEMALKTRLAGATDAMRQAGARPNPNGQPQPKPSPAT